MSDSIRLSSRCTARQIMIDSSPTSSQSEAIGNGRRTVASNARSAQRDTASARGPATLLGRRDGDVFGRTVNWAARISSQADAHEVLVTREVIEASAEVEATYESIGAVGLKGIADPVELFRAARG